MRATCVLTVPSADVKLLGDLRVGPAAREFAQDVAFAFGQTPQLRWLGLHWSRGQESFNDRTSDRGSQQRIT